MKILVIDSSSITASVAVIENEKIVSEFFINAGLTHSQTLAPMVKSTLEFSGRKTSDMDLISDITPSYVGEVIYTAFILLFSDNNFSTSFEFIAILIPVFLSIYGKLYITLACLRKTALYADL